MIQQIATTILWLPTVLHCLLVGELLQIEQPTAVPQLCCRTLNSDHQLPLPRTGTRAPSCARSFTQSRLRSQNYYWYLKACVEQLSCLWGLLCALPPHRCRPWTGDDQRRVCSAINTEWTLRTSYQCLRALWDHPSFVNIIGPSLIQSTTYPAQFHNITLQQMQSPTFMLLVQYHSLITLVTQDHQSL